MSIAAGKIVQGGAAICVASVSGEDCSFARLQTGQEHGFCWLVPDIIS